MCWNVYRDRPNAFASWTQGGSASSANGTVILYAVLIMALNLLVDVVQAWMNPKVRLES